MKVTATLSFLLAAGLARASTTACNADNCARQITGTRSKTPDLAVRQTDCANYMTTTVYATPTATTTPAVVYQRRRDGGIDKRNPVTVTGTVPAYATDCTGAADYSSACSCWGFTATTITVATPTTTVAAATPTCSKGLQWAFYSFTDCGDNPSTPGCLASDYSYPYSNEYSPEVFEHQTPDFTGVTGETGGVTDYDQYGNCDASGSLTVFGTSTSPYQTPDTGIQQRGYFIPQVAGIYTLTANNADEIVVVWIGQVAYTYPNAALLAYWAEGTVTGTYTVSAAGVGVPVPIRIQWANAQGCANFDLTITDPNSNVILGSSTSPSDIFVQFCTNDGTLAPAYPVWQAETY